MGTIWVIFAKESAVSSKTMRFLMATGSGGENVHCEIILPHRKFARASAWINLGVVFKDFYPLNLNPKKYEVFVIDNVDAEAIYQYHASQVGKKYDTAGLLLTMFLGIKKKGANPEQWFCSEINYHELTKIAGLPLLEMEAHNVTPQMLYLMLKELGYESSGLSKII